MTPADLTHALFDIVSRIAERRGGTGEGAVAIDEADVAVERPKRRDHGDWASNIALRLAKRIGANPRDLAEEIAHEACQIPGVASAEVAGPGFINFRLEAAAAGLLARTIVEAGDRYGMNDSQTGRTINLEFVSGNPTGPIHLAHTRWAAVGDSMARVLRAAGATVATEYYINDAGSQMRKFGLSVVAAANNEPTPPDGYPGKYISSLADDILAEEPNILDRADADERIRSAAYQRQMAEIKQSLERFHVHFDVWFSELTLHAVDADGSSAIDRAATRLREQGHVFERDGAVWVRTTAFGDDKDRVMVRSSGEYTYFAADAAYYLDKRDRGFTEKIYLLGADHHGYVQRLRAISGAAGDDPDKNIRVLIGQMVTVNGAKLSKRAGNIVELTDLLDWLGADALRYWLARYPSDTPLDLDGEQLRKRSNDNPVFYVQYAHARTCSVARNAREHGVDHSQFDPSLLTHESASALLGALQEFPRIVGQAASMYEPHRVARFLEEVAGLYHKWYDNCRVLPLGDDPVGPLHRTRLWLNDATGQVIRNGLEMLGVSAPERM